MPDLELPVDQKVAAKVLANIDELVVYCKDTVDKLEKGFVRLGVLLAEVSQNKYYLLRGYRSQEEYIKATFPQGRSTYYDLLDIGSHLAEYPRALLESLGRTKCAQLIKVKKHCGTIPENWWLHAKKDDRDSFKRRVKSYLSGDGAPKPPEQEDHFITFRIFGDAIIVVNKGLEIMGRILGSYKSTGDRLEKLFLNFLSQFEEDGTGHVVGENAFILSTVSGLIKQLDWAEKGLGDRLVGTIAAAAEECREPKLQAKKSETRQTGISQVTQSDI